MERSFIKILLVEDDEDDYILFADWISNIKTSQFHLDWVKTHDSAIEAMSQGKYDICFLDYRLGTHTGLEVLQQAFSRGFDAPIIILTGQGDYEVDLRAMKAGATDYLVKGEFDATVLERVIRYSLARAEFQRALKKAHDELEMRVEERTRQLIEANRDLQKEITIRHAAEKALKDSESLLNAIICAVPDIIYRLDEKGLITFISDAVRRYGYSPEKLMGLPVIEIIHLDDRKEVLRCIRERRTLNRRTKGIELRLLKKNVPETGPDGGIPQQENEPMFLLSSEGLYETDESGNRKFIGTQGILRDISPIKEEQARREKLEAYLRQAEKMEAIGILSGGIAHDFNNLLSSVLGNINLAQTSVGSEEDMFAVLNAAEAATLQVADLTRKLISFSKGGAPISEKQRISPVLKKACESIFSESPVAYELHFPEDQWMVEIDERQIQIAMESILNNAVEAMPKGGTVEVKTVNICSPDDLTDTALPIVKGRYVKVSIKDHGCGIPPEILSHIFEPYFTTKEMGTRKGLGLGLSIVHTIIEKHGGYIFVESDLNKGTSVDVYFPAFD